MWRTNANHESLRLLVQLSVMPLVIVSGWWIVALQFPAAVAAMRQPDRMSSAASCEAERPRR
jgi:hypothetical protein